MMKLFELIRSSYQIDKSLNSSENDRFEQLFSTTLFTLFCCIAEFLVMLLHDTLHSKQVIKVQDLIKHCDSLLASGRESETH
ncbi:unnamed protein product, partial [Rotaria sp. Silwood1]